MSLWKGILDLIREELKMVDENVDNIVLELSHLSYVFPENSNEIVTLTAHANDDTFNAWTEIINNNAVTLTSKGVACRIHISSLKVESASVTDKVYVYEISYGSSKIIIAKGRLISGNVRISINQTEAMKSLYVPIGETIYYRIKCETGGANITVSLRYHCD